MISRSFYYLRHGETDWNVESRLQGQLDVPLNDTGRRQAREAAIPLAGSGLVAIVASPLSRARETAEIVNKTLCLPLRFDAQLMERHFGVLQGLTKLEIDGRIEAGLRTHHGPVEADGYSCPIEGEPLADLDARIVASIAEITAAVDGPVLIVGHGGPYRSLQRRLFNRTQASPNAWPIYFERNTESWCETPLLRPDPTALARLQTDALNA